MKSTTGNLQDNPIHRDMLFAAQKAGLDFILNVVLDADKNIIGAFAGDSVAAHEEGCAFVRSLAKISATPAEIVITSNGAKWNHGSDS